MKQTIALLAAFLYSIFGTYCQNISLKEFDEEYKGRIHAEGTNIVFRKIFEYPQFKKEELYERAKAYLDDRIQKKYVSESTNTDFSYSDMSLIITETKDDFIWEKTFISKVYFSIEYVLKLEIKDYKVRATIMPSRFLHFDNYYDFKECWPFTDRLKKNMQKRILYQLVDYTDALFDHIENGIAEDIAATDDNW